MNRVVEYIYKTDRMISSFFKLHMVSAKKISKKKNISFSQIGYRCSFNEKAEKFLTREHCSLKEKNKILSALSPIIAKGVEICALKK